MKKLLIVGATPPPVHGCSVAIRLMLDSDLARRYRILHLDIADRRNLDNLGRFDFTNVLLGLRHGLAFVAMLLRGRPDVVYLILSQNRWAFLRDLVFIIPAVLTGTPFVAHLQGGRMVPFLRETDGLTRRLAVWSLRKAARVLALGECFRDDLLAAVPDVKVEIVPNAAPRVAGQSPVRRDGETVHVLYLASLIPSKGFPDLIEAALRLEASNVRFTFAGSPVGEEALRAIDRAKSLAPQMFEFVGVVEGERKRALLESADVFAFPTWYEYEAHPFVLLEAMAAGLAIVTTDWAAIPETVRDEQEALVIKPRDIDALVGALNRLCSDRELRMRLGQAARTRYLAKYTTDAWIDRLAAVFDSVIVSNEAEPAVLTHVARVPE